MSARLSLSALYSTLLLVVGVVSCGGGDGVVKRKGVARSALDTEIQGPSGISLFVPAGAVTADTTLTISVVPSIRPPREGAVVASPVRLQPEGQQFARPVELTIPIDTSSLPPASTVDDVVVMRAPAGTETYVPLPTRRAGSASVAVLTEHFSDFVAVVFTADASMGAACGDRLCASDETCDTCPLDCGLCVGANLCGNGACEANEACSSCPYDCRCVSGNGCIGDFVDDAGMCGMLTTCAAGTYEQIAPTPGNDRICAPCEPGSYSDVSNAKTCTPCPIGTASSTTAATSASACQACASGLEATTPGLSQCTDIDECLVNNGGCTGGTPYCWNNVGAPPTCTGISPAGLTLWLDAGSSVFSDAGTTAATNGGSVQIWRDRSPAAHDCTQTTVSAQPTFSASVAAFNNQPTLHFSAGATALLTCSDSLTIGTLFAVVSYDAATFSALYPGVFGHKNAGSTALLYGNTSITTYGTDATGGISLNGATSTGQSTAATTITAPALLTVLSPTPVSDAMWVGRSDIISATWNGNIAEIIAYDTALDAASVRAVECYLGAKYNLTLGHACP